MRIKSLNPNVKNLWKKMKYKRLSNSHGFSRYFFIPSHYSQLHSLICLFYSKVTFKHFLNIQTYIVYKSFILNKGVELGDSQVKNWLISLIITILTGIFITQPLQVSFTLEHFCFILNFLKKIE